MHDALRVRASDRFGGLPDVITGVFDAERSVRRQGAGEVLTAQQLHHHERRSVAQGAHVVDAYYVVGDERRGGTSLAQEALASLVSAFVLVRDDQHFDRHSLAEIEVRRGEHDAHPSATHDRVHAVFSDNDLADRRDGGGSFLLRTVDLLDHRSGLSAAAQNYELRNVA